MQWLLQALSCSSVKTTALLPCYTLNYFMVLYVDWFTTSCTIFIHTYTVSLIIVHSIRQSSIESRLQSRGLELPENPLQHPNSSQLLPCPLHAGRIKPFCHCDCHWVNPFVGGGPFQAIGHRCFTTDVLGKMIVVETRIPNINFGKSMCVVCMSTVSMKAL